MRKRIITLLAAFAAIAGLAVGGTALASGDGPAPSSPSAAHEATGDNDAVQDENGKDDASEAAESEQGEAAEDGDRTEEPSYTGSITAPEQDGASEADEAKALESLATVTPDQASRAALAAVPGTVAQVELDNENGSVVYSVEVTRADGTTVDVKIDAGNAAVLAQEAGDDEAGESGESGGIEQPEGSETEAPTSR